MINHHLVIRRHREVPGRNYDTPKELWGFTLQTAKGSSKGIAEAVLQANENLLGLGGIRQTIRPQRVVHSLGGWHVIFQQVFDRYRVHRAYVTVHMDQHRRVYMIKNRAVPKELLRPAGAFKVGKEAAAAAARRAVSRDASGQTVMQYELVWFPARRLLHLAHKFRIHRRRPRQEWIIYVSGETGRILSKYDNLAAATGRARAFNPNPVVALGDWQPLLRDGEPIHRVPLQLYEAVALRGVAPSGVLSGPRVTTNPTPHRVRRPSLDFVWQSHQRGFEEVMAYYHLDRAIRYVESLGYRGARRIFTKPLPANARAGREDNSWYSPGRKSLGFGTGDVDDAEDGETILHEFGHALQDAICPDFGQSAEAAAMGEGFGDYFAASFFAETKEQHGAAVLVPTVMSWDGILTGPADDPSRPPCVRRLDSLKTYESFDHSSIADEHENGEIWSATLWEIRKSVGRDVADRIVIESHFQLDGFTNFARGARAILDADRHLFAGRHLSTLKTVFRRRGIGPVE